MKILITGTKWYGNVEYFYGKAFKKLGHSVEFFYYNETQSPLYEKIFSYQNTNIPWLSKKLAIFYNKNINRKLLTLFSDLKPDLVIVLNGLQIFPETLRKIKQAHIPLINWLGDDPFRFDSLIYNLEYYTHIFVTEPLHIPPIKFLTKAYVDYLPNATDPEVFFPLDQNKINKELKSDIAFIGHSYNADGNGLLRGKMLNTLAKKYDLKIYGDSGWKKIIKVFPSLKKCFVNKITTSEETNKIYNAAKIILNIHHTQNKISTAQRTFEIASAKAFQLAENKEEIKRLFPNNEIICFNSCNDLIKKIAEYINNDKMRKEKSCLARKIVLDNHTYIHRVKKILNSI